MALYALYNRLVAERAQLGTRTQALVVLAVLRCACAVRSLAASAACAALHAYKSTL